MIIDSEEDKKHQMKDSFNLKKGVRILNFGPNKGKLFGKLLIGKRNDISWNFLQRTKEGKHR